jgi:ribosomal protein S27AE
MDNERQQELIKKLTEKGAILPCPRCGNGNFSVIDGYGYQTLQDVPRGFVIGGKGIPTVITACNNCGFLAFHALGALEKLPEPEKPSPPPPEPPAK